MKLTTVKQVYHLVFKEKNTTATTIAANVTLNHSEGSSVLSELRDAINNYILLLVLLLHFLLTIHLL